MLAAAAAAHHIDSPTLTPPKQCDGKAAAYPSPAPVVSITSLTKEAEPIIQKMVRPLFLLTCPVVALMMPGHAIRISLQQCDGVL